MKPFKHEIQKKKWDKLRKRVGTSIALSVIGGGAVATAIAVPTMLYGCKDKGNTPYPTQDTNYKIDGTNWEGYISGKLGPYIANKNLHTVFYVAPGNYVSHNMVFPDFVKDDDENIYAIYQLGDNDDFSEYNANLSGQITFPKYLSIIGSKAFYGCRDISCFDFSRVEKLDYIGDSAFAGCGITNVNPGKTLHRVDLSSIFGDDFYVYAMDKFTFNNPDSPNFNEILKKGCGGLGYGKIAFTSVVREINRSAFLNCAGITSVDFSKMGGTHTGNDSFVNCPNLTSITLGNNITEIDAGSFVACSKLQTINFVGTTPSLHLVVGPVSFADCVGISQLTFGQTGDLTLLNGAFRGCTHLTRVDFSNVASISDIYQDAFEGCSFSQIIGKSGVLEEKNVTSSCGENLHVYGNRSFSTFDPSQNSLRNSGCGCLAYGSVKINETALQYSKITNWAFYGCGGIKSVDFSSLTTEIQIEDSAFALCSLTSIVGKAGFLEEKNVSSVCGPNFHVFALPTTSITIGSTPLRMPGCGCLAYGEISFDSSIAQIGGQSFQFCSGITSVDFSNAANINKIYDYAFHRNLITNIKFGAVVPKTIFAHAFWDLSSLSEISFTSGLPTESLDWLPNCISQNESLGSSRGVVPISVSGPAQLDWTSFLNKTITLALFKPADGWTP